MLKKIALSLLIILYFSVTYILFDYYGISCVFLKFFGIPCPGCGMTRAAMAIADFDFIQAAKCNVVVFFMPYVFMYIFFDFKHKIHNVILVTIALISIINWFFKITMFI